jgi:hypothetical protein
MAHCQWRPTQNAVPASSGRAARPSGETRERQGGERRRREAEDAAEGGPGGAGRGRARTTGGGRWWWWWWQWWLWHVAVAVLVERGAWGVEGRVNTGGGWGPSSSLLLTS